MSAFKVGDLVMVVGQHDALPYCIQFYGSFRRIRTPSMLKSGLWKLDPPTIDAADGLEISWREGSLKKIDPPETGETTEAYINIKVPA